MTLSRFLRDYIYIPLGGNRKGKFRTYNNLLATFVLGGLWHGAGWTFIFWGFLHGIALVIHRFWSKLGFKLYTWIAWLITFNFVNIAWVFFRAREWDDAIKILKGMFGFSGIVLPNIFLKISFIKELSFVKFDIYINDKWSLIWIMIGFVIIAMKNSIELKDKFQPNKNNLIFLCFLSISFLFINKASEFLYFNF